MARREMKQGVARYGLWQPYSLLERSEHKYYCKNKGFKKSAKCWNRA
jgi:hypothetical protein